MKDPDLEIAWRHDLHVPPNDRTILERDVIVAPERNTKLCRVDPRSGTTMWEASIQSVWGWLAADRQRVVYLNQHSLLQCHDLGTGAKTWQLDLDGTFGHLFAHRGFVVTGGWRGYTPVTAIDLDSGEIAWRGRAPKHVSHPTAWGEHLAFPVPQTGRLNAFSTTQLLLLDPATGNENGAIPLPSRKDLPDGGHLVGAYAGDLYYADDRNTIWTLQGDSEAFEPIVVHRRAIRTFRPVVTDSFILFEDESGALCSCVRATGELLWDTPVVNRRRDLLAAVELPDRLVGFGSTDGRLQVFNQDGWPIASSKLGKRITTRLTALEGGNVVCGTGGELVSVQINAHSPW